MSEANREQVSDNEADCNRRGHLHILLVQDRLWLDALILRVDEGILCVASKICSWHSARGVKIRLANVDDCALLADERGQLVDDALVVRDLTRLIIIIFHAGAAGCLRVDADVESVIDDYGSDHAKIAINSELRRINLDGDRGALI